MKGFPLLASCPIVLVFLCALSLSMRVADSTFISKNVAIIVLGNGDFAGASNKCFNLTRYSWNTERNSIMYLSTNMSLTPDADKVADKTNFTSALTNWLPNHCDNNSTVWLWVFSHGVGLYHHPPDELYGESWEIEYMGGRPEVNSDEGPEITEALIGNDTNHDGHVSNTTWVGVDEGISLHSPSGMEIVWDDEVNQSLSSINCRRMVCFMSSCKIAGQNETESCFSGGFIDDLSAPRRIIISPTNETFFSCFNDTSGLGWFEDAFMDALTPNTPAWDATINSIDADDYPSVLEAFKYAYDHDMARKIIRLLPDGTDPWKNIYPIHAELDESPWLDDGGNFLPTFVNFTDVGANSTQPYDSGDSWLARYTWPFVPRYSGCVEDVNDDGSVDVTDVYIVGQCYGDSYPLRWRSKASLADVNQDNTVDVTDYYAIQQKYGWGG